MHKPELTGTQAELPASRFCLSVFPVACNRRPRMSQLDPNLVMPAGQKPDPQKTPVFPLFQHLIGKCTPFGALRP